MILVPHIQQYSSHLAQPINLVDRLYLIKHHVSQSNQHQRSMRTLNQYSSHLQGFLLPPYPPNSDRKSTRLNSSHVAISYAVFCLKKKIPEVAIGYTP